MNKEKVVISPSIVWWTIGIALAVGFLYVIRDVLVLFFIALVLSAAMNPAIKQLVRKRISRPVAVGLVYVVLLAAMVAFLSYLIPRAVSQASSFIDRLPEYSKQFSQNPLSNAAFRSVSDILGDDTGLESSRGLGGVTQGVFGATLGVFSGIVSFLAVFTIAFYLSVVEDGVGKFLRSITPRQYEEYIVSRARIIYGKIGYWMLGQIFLMIIVGTLYFILLSLLGVPNALVIALLGGALEIIPYIGPVTAAVPAILFGFFVSPAVALAVMAGYVLIQQLENHVIVPQVMKRAVGLNPIVVILALLMGAKVAGVLGMILAVPVATAINVFVKDVLERKEMQNDEL